MIENRLPNKEIAANQQRAYGLQETDEVPRIPGKINIIPRGEVMEELVIESVKEMVEKLKSINWFENCGNKNQSSIYEISYAKDADSAIKHCSSTRWENIQLDKYQDVSSYLNIYKVKTKYRWNDVVSIIKKYVLPEILENVRNKWDLKYGESKEISIEIESVLLTFLLLYAFHEYKEEPFHKELLNIYEQGYFPCGWKGTYPNGKIIIF